MSTGTERPRWASTILRFLPPALLLVHALLLAYSLRHQFATRDEVAHVPAGLAIWDTGTFSLYRLNPH
jgi:hypothetical protein